MWVSRLTSRSGAVSFWPTCTGVQVFGMNVRIPVGIHLDAQELRASAERLGDAEPFGLDDLLRVHLPVADPDALVLPLASSRDRRGGRNAPSAGTAAAPLLSLRTGAEPPTGAGAWRQAAVLRAPWSRTRSRSSGSVRLRT